MIKSATPILLFIHCIILTLCTTSHCYTSCNRSCPGGSFHHVPYPFGFSSDCPIQLNCSQNGTVFIDQFPVTKFTPDRILVHLPAQCARSVESLQRLYGRNYAPTSHNAILLENCTSHVQTCMIPSTMLQTHLELLGCGGQDNNSVSCYTEVNKTNMFLNYRNVTRTGCRSLFSGIATEIFVNTTAVSLDVQLVQLGWWIEGKCQCSDVGATCTSIESPTDGRKGYRCDCVEGFIGDGYKAGLGCRKESSGCNPSKYLSGRCGGQTRVGALIGGLVIGACIIISVGLICCFIRRRSNSKTKNRAKRELCEATGMSIPIYPYKDIVKATDSFSDKRRLGTGAYGTVYSGKLMHSGSDEWVAIKRIKHRADTDSIQQVMNEIKLLSSVSHPNLVRLLGCSVEKGEQILVYEFMPNGTLCQHLQRERGNGLAWPVRLTIATETAQAIAYLHSAMNPPIYHRDVKSSNILLDYNYKTKVADFGLSRLGIMESISHISTAPQGTPGYLDPQYHQNFHLSDKSDVYSFGVVLVEIITAMKAVDFSRRQNEVTLTSLAIDRIGRGRLDEIIDPFLDPNKDAWTASSIHKVAELAFRCLAFQSEMRPSMKEVAAELEQIKSSKWATAEEGVILSFKGSTCSLSSLSSTVCQKQVPNLVDKKKDQLGRRLSDVNGNSMEEMRDFSRVSVQDPWPSDASSPSSISLLNHVVP